MSRGKAERFSHRRAHKRIGWTAAILAVGLIPHVKLAAEYRPYWPPGLICIHVGIALFIGLAALLIACTQWLARRWDEQARDVFQAGRAEKFDEKFDEFEQRQDRN